MAVLDQTLEHRRAGQIDDTKASAIEERRHRQRHAGLHAHAPQALLAVAHGLVQKFNMRHGGSSSVVLLKRRQDVLL